MPQFVPVLSLSETTGNAISRQMSVDESLAYLNNVISNLDVAETMTRSVYTFTKATEYFFRPVSSAIKCYRLINSPRRHTFFFFQFIFFYFLFFKNIDILRNKPQSFSIATCHAVQCLPTPGSVFSKSINEKIQKHCGLLI